MDPLTISLLVGAASSAVQGIAGIFQKNKANRLAEQYPRPEAKFDPYLQKAIDYYRNRSFDTDVPGGNIYRDELKGVTAAGIKAATQLSSGAEAFGALGKMTQNEQDLIAKQGASVAENVLASRDKYANLLAGPGYQESQRVDYWNNQMPYLQAAQKAMLLNESGSQNIMAGVKNIAGIATEAAMPDMYSSLFTKRTNNTGDMSPEEMKVVIKWLTKKNN